MKKEGYDIYVSSPDTDMVNKIGYADCMANITQAIEFYMESIGRPITQLETVIRSNGVNTHSYKHIKDLTFISKKEEI